jgi:hypothetical protein
VSYLIFVDNLLDLEFSERHVSPNVGSPPGRVGIAREVLVFKGTYDLVLGHAIGERDDTEGDIWKPVDNGICWEVQYPFRDSVNALQSSTDC